MRRALCYCFGAGLIQVVDRYLRAFGGEAFCDGLADAVAGAGHDDYFICKAFHSMSKVVDEVIDGDAVGKGGPLFLVAGFVGMLPGVA